MIKNNDNIEAFELNSKSDLIAANCQCPQCGNKYLFGVPYIHVPCNKCGITFRTDFEQDIYTKKARQLLSKISFRNSLLIRADDKYEGSLIHIRQHFIEQHCWDVSEIQSAEETYKRCLNCGVCFNCYTCKGCGKAFQRDPNKRKQSCPQCKTSNFVKTYFREVHVNQKNKEIRLCPHCNSDKIKMMRTRNKIKCHACNSRKLTESKSNIVYSFTVERKKAYRRENV